MESSCILHQTKALLSRYVSLTTHTIPRIWLVTCFKLVRFTVVSSSKFGIVLRNANVFKIIYSNSFFVLCQILALTEVICKKTKNDEKIDIFFTKFIIHYF